MNKQLKILSVGASVLRAYLPFMLESKSNILLFRCPKEVDLDPPLQLLCVAGK